MPLDQHCPWFFFSLWIKVRNSGNIISLYENLDSTNSNFYFDDGDGNFRQAEIA